MPARKRIMGRLAPGMGNTQSNVSSAYDSDSDSESEADEAETEKRTTEIVILIYNKKTKTDELFRVLLDSGTNRCMGTRSAIQRAGLHIKKSRRIHRYNTAAGVFTTTCQSRIRTHKILELNSRRNLSAHKVQVRDGQLGAYDFIFGRDYLFKFGIDLIFSEKVIHWDGMRMPMKEMGHYANPSAMQSTLMMHTTGERNAIRYKARDTLQSYAIIDNEIYETKEIKESKYEKQDLRAIADQQVHLSMEQRNLLYETLFKHNESLFEGKLGTWPNDSISAELKPNAKPFHCGRPIRIPHIHVGTLKEEVNRLCSIGVLEEVSGTKSGPWCAPSFIIPKKDGRVRFITDFRQLNKWIKRKPWPMPHISDLIQDIGKYKYVTAIDLSMGYYHFVLDEELSAMTTFMLPWGLYRYKRLPMGLNISPDIFQEKISKLFLDKPYARAYMDDLLIWSNGSYEDHLTKVKEVLQRLHEKNLAVNALKSFWAVEEVDYLGFRLTPNGVLPQPKKIKAMVNMARPKTKKQLRGFIGLVNYYRYMWRKRSHLLTPLSEMAGKNKPFKWTEECEKSFREVKKVISEEVLLSFPDYTKKFELYTDASDYQLGAMLKQGNNTLAFFSKKLNAAQKNYGVGEKEMLSVVEALKEFRTMVKGYPIDVYVDHKNWTHDKSMRNDRVMRWRLALEEFDITFHYIQGEKNVVADALSRLIIPDTTDDELNVLEEVMDIEPADWRRYYQPITIAEIGREQKKDKYLQKLQEQAPDKLGELFEDIGKKSGADHVVTELDATDNQQRIIVPQSLRKRLMAWYHTMLVHPGSDRMYYTLRQHYTWPNMSKEIKLYTKHCEACQKAKRGVRGRGHIPMKDTETEPWRDVALDLAGPWDTVINGETVRFWTFTIIDVFTGWPEIIPIQTKKMEVIRDLFVQEWLRRYPRPSRVIYDLGSEFDNEEFKKLFATWYMKPEGITAKNPRANAIVERMHRILGDMLRVQLTTKHEKEDVVKELTSAAAYGLRATVHGTTQYSPAQQAFGKDMILRTNMVADVELVRQRRQRAIEVNNARENKRRIKHKYKKGDKILILSGRLDPKLKLHEGPYKVVSYNESSGTLHIQRKNYIEPINIRQVRPYFGTIRGGD